MQELDKQIKDIDNVICKNIEMLPHNERWIVTENILSQLRNFVEHIALKIYSQGQNIDNSYENICTANNYIK